MEDDNNIARRGPVTAKTQSCGTAIGVDLAASDAAYEDGFMAWTSRSVPGALRASRPILGVLEERSQRIGSAVGVRGGASDE